VEGRQMYAAMEKALEQAGIGPRQVDGIHVSANFSMELGRAEALQVARLMGRGPEDIRVTPLKLLCGDFGGAGALRAAAICLGFAHRKPLPTICAADLQSELSLGNLQWSCQGPSPDRVLMTGSTFGGGSAGLVFTSFERADGP